MKNGILIGVALGVVTATALYTRTNSGKMLKRGKRAIVRKIEDML